MTKLAFAIHPGEVLREEFMSPFNLRAYTLAKHLHVPRTRIERLASEEGPVTPDTALRLAKYFGTTPQFWMNMQAAYDLARTQDALRSELVSIRPANEAPLDPTRHPAAA